MCRIDDRLAMKECVHSASFTFNVVQADTIIHADRSETCHSRRLHIDCKSCAALAKAALAGGSMCALP